MLLESCAKYKKCTTLKAPELVLQIDVMIVEIWYQCVQYVVGDDVMFLIFKPN